MDVAGATLQPETETERLLMAMTERILNPLRILSQPVLKPLSMVVPARAGRRRREHVLRRPRGLRARGRLRRAGAPERRVWTRAATPVSHTPPVCFV